MVEIGVEYINYDEKMSPRDRRSHEHNVAYGLLFNMLKKHFGIEQPTILKTENGKPYIELDGVHFSISHTKGLCACAVANTPVGIDCEYVKGRDKEDMLRFAKRYFTENEIALLEKGGYCPTDFYKIWTAKESCIKKRGTNMGDVKKIDITKENIQFFCENGYIISINI